MTFRMIPLLLAIAPLAAVAQDACQLTDPQLTLQSYTVDAQHERIAMYWRQPNGKAYDSLRGLLNAINDEGRVQMAIKPMCRWGCISKKASRRWP